MSKHEHNLRPQVVGSIASAVDSGDLLVKIQGKQEEAQAAYLLNDDVLLGIIQFDLERLHDRRAQLWKKNTK